MTAPVDGARATLALGARALPPGSSVALALAGARLRMQAVACQGAAPVGRMLTVVATEGEQIVFEVSHERRLPRSLLRMFAL